jgi:hypothetical protein
VGLSSSGSVPLVRSLLSCGSRSTVRDLRRVLKLPLEPLDRYDKPRSAGQSYSKYWLHGKAAVNPLSRNHLLLWNLKGYYHIHKARYWFLPWATWFRFTAPILILLKIHLYAFCSQNPQRGQIIGRYLSVSPRFLYENSRRTSIKYGIGHLHTNLSCDCDFGPHRLYMTLKSIVIEFLKNGSQYEIIVSCNKI